MTTKDYVYLGLILLTALIFYCHGFYSGVYRCRKLYTKLYDEAPGEDGEEMPSPPPRQRASKSGESHDPPYCNN